MSEINKDDDMFEEMLAKALGEYVEKCGEKYENELNAIPQPEYSKGFEKKIKKIIKENSISKGVWYKNRTVKFAAVISLILIFNIQFISSIDADKFRFITKYFIEDNDSTKISFGENTLNYNFEEIPVGWDYISLPQYMPPGYKVDKYSIDDNVIYIYYKNGADTVIFMQSRNIESGVNIDNENSKIKTVSVNGKEAYIVENGERNILVWDDERYLYSLLGGLDRDELVKAAESLKRMDSK
ncbi:DUF4367 domain-containing protein [Anaerotignum faecicola]|nr:DUF4367 domain-containing protein [Anaerotignum faecicola]